MTTDDARRFLKDPRMIIKLTALSYVSLSELETDIIYLRYFLQLTQERAVERIPLVYSERLGISREDAAYQYGLSVTGLQKIEKRALDKCCVAWDKLTFVREILKKATL